MLTLFLTFNELAANPPKQTSKIPITGRRLHISHCLMLQRTQKNIESRVNARINVLAKSNEPGNTGLAHLKVTDTDKSVNFR